MERKVRVIVVEDVRFLREVLVDGLGKLGIEATGVENCLEFYQLIARPDSSFSVAVVDLGLPDQDGYVLTEYIRKNTGLGIIIVSALSGEEDRIKAYNRGADLYLPKPVAVRELAAAITNLAQRLEGSQVAGKKPLREDAQNWLLVKRSWRLLPPRGKAITLTPKEMQFIELLAAKPGDPVRRDGLLSALGYRDDEYAMRAMDSLVRRLRRKMEKHGCRQCPIKTVHAVGYCFSAPIAVS